MSALTNVFTDIANSIRSKMGGVLDTYEPIEMANAINNIPTGISEFEVTTGNVITTFNMPVTIPNNIKSIASCFSYCYEFNQPITIPNSITNMAACFSYCYEFNQPITIPNNVINMEACFRSCSKLNQPITISNSVISIYSCFNSCGNFNQPIIIPNSVINTAYILSYCLNFGQDVYLTKTNLAPTNYSSMFKGCNNLKIKRIFVGAGASMGNLIAQTNARSIVGGEITWTTNTNCVYNTKYNVYIYNNK